MKYYLAIDIGASSGRHIVGYKKDNEIVTDEVYRFSNGVKEENGHLVWDTDYLVEQVKKGIDVALKQYKLTSISIDTWGVDYVLMDNDSEIKPVYAYRDNRTSEVIEKVHSIVSFDKLYEHTGSQFQPFNTIYQLYWDYQNKRLEKATDYLMIPEYLLYKLTGKKVNEFTNASTTGLINHQTLQLDKEIIDKLRLPKQLFKELTQPKKVLGKYLGVNVVLCATHDTASAVEGIPMVGNEPYISSGTWSLLGIKTDNPLTDKKSQMANYSNEGGINYNRYQKNIMGLWLINELKRELCPDISFEELTKLVKESKYEDIVDANDEIFLAPKSMKDAFDQKLNKKLEMADYFKCAYLSLAHSYDLALKELEENTKKKYNCIYIVGGGAKSSILNELTEKITGKKVIALPIEATALGNLKVQMEVSENE